MSIKILGTAGIGNTSHIKPQQRDNLRMGAHSYRLSFNQTHHQRLSLLVYYILMVVTDRSNWRDVEYVRNPKHGAQMPKCRISADCGPKPKPKLTPFPQLVRAYSKLGHLSSGLITQIWR